MAVRNRNTELKGILMRKLQKPKDVVVSRKKWLRGEGEGFLFRSDDKKMCCLGFMCKAAGATEQDMENLSVPSELYERKQIEAGFCLKDSTNLDFSCNDDWIFEAVNYNDRSDITRDEREKHLKRVFNQQGISVKFVD